MRKVDLFRLAFRFLPRLPRRFVQVMALLGADLAWLLLPQMRARVAANLCRIPALAASPKRLRATTRQSFRSLALNYIDLFVPPNMEDPRIYTWFDIRNIKDLVALNTLGRGAIMVSLHSSGLEWGCWMMSRLVHGPIITPMETLSPPELYQLVVSQRGRSGIQFVPVTESESLRTMISALRAGQHVLLAGDRDVLHTGMAMPFFDAPARIPTGAVVLARLTGAPIYVVSLWRTGLQRFAGYVTPLDITVRERGEAALRKGLETLTAQLEREIARHPEGWLGAFAEDIWESSEVSDPLPVDAATA
jgi:phosphatidylinositol dimannoside acyltransferase